MPLRVHMSSNPDQNALEHLNTHLDSDIQLSFGSDVPENADYSILISGRPSTELLSASPHLEILLIPWAGLPDVTRQRMAEFPQIAIHNLHHNASPTAEMALALLFAVARKLIPSDSAFRKNDWTPRYETPSMLLRGKTALILGYGAIGTYLGYILKALGLTVIGTRRRHTDPDNGIYASDQLHDLLPQANILIIALPGTPDTENLIAEHEIALMPQDAIIINIGRGQVINQQALYDALKSGKLFGAGSDVWYHYPTDKESRTDTAPADVPFHELDNMVMSPHRAGAGGNDEIEILRMSAIAEILNTAKRGNPIPHRVDLSLGY